MGTQGFVQSDCSEGARALGGGGTADSGYNTAYVNATYPEDGPDANEKRDDAWRVYVDALETVSVSVSVVCLEGKAAKSLKYMREVKHLPEGTTRSARAPCPPGYKVTGGGVSNSGVFNEAKVKATRPVKRNTAWEGTVRNISTHNEKIFVYAVCARGSFAKDLAYRDEDGKAGPHTSESVVTVCLHGGKATGSGVRVRRGPSNVNRTDPTRGDAAVADVDAIGSEPIKFTNYVICHR
jgi:hypothetical protein